MRYTVDVTREGDDWLATVRDLQGAHTLARTRTALDAHVREVIELVADLEDGAGYDVEYVYDTGLPELIHQGAAAAQRRHELDREQTELQIETAALAARMIASGYSVRDAAGILGISPGRVNQITGKAMRHAS